MARCVSSTRAGALVTYGCCRRLVMEHSTPSSMVSEGIGWKGPRVRHLSADGAATTLVEMEGTRTRVIETEREAAADVALVCAPNPFNGQTLISYSLPEPAHVHLRVFNSVGWRVKDLVDAVQATGSHGITWDATDDEGRAVSSGVYLCELRFGGETQTVSLTLLR